jgi:prepilin-type processing-associated H-X9-DG protein
MRYRQPHGFTLKELFVLYGLLAVLALILWPVFFGAREKAKESSCQSNLKQLTMAILMYAEDYDGTLPPAVAPSGIGWSRLANRYVRNDELFRCPEDVERFRKARPLDLDHPNGFSYIANGEAMRSPSAPGLRHETIRNASSVILLAERNRVIPVSWRLTKATFPAAVAGQRHCFPAAVVGLPHYKGANYAFADGHVKWMKLEAFQKGQATIEPDLAAGTAEQEGGPAKR